MKLLQRVIGPDRDQPVRPGRRGQPRGDRDRHRDTVRRVGHHDARGTRLDAEAHRQHAPALGSHRRQRRGSAATGAHIAAHTLDRHGLEHPSSADGAVSRSHRPCRPSTWPRARASGSARSTSRCCTRPATPKARSACWPRRAPAVHRRHALRRQLGPDRSARRLGRADGRLARPTFEDWPTSSSVRPGHGPTTTLEREMPWLSGVAASRRLPF